MATPAMQASSVSVIVTPGSAGKIKFNTLDSAGAALDVSSGYTIGFINAVPSGNVNPLKAPVDLSSLMTPAFSATGVEFSYTAAQASSIAAALSTLNSSVGVGLSNDSGTTSTLAAVVGITVRADAQFAA